MDTVNPAALAARVLVDELVRCGVREAVLCPGSRSAPLAYALAAADEDPQMSLRLHVRTDERAAGFLALGLAAATGRVVPVVTTSGTAVANLHPALLEAHHQRVPVMALTADRPPELRGTGANQTTDQPGLLRDVRLAVDLGTPADAAAEAPSWRTAVDRAVAAALGALGGDAGPVHLNVPFREPLVPQPPAERATSSAPATWLPDEAGAPAVAGRPDGRPWTEVPTSGTSVAGRPGGRRWTEVPTSGTAEEVVAVLPEGPDRTLVLLGDLGSPRLARAVQAGAAQRQWPVVAEPFGRFGGDTAVPHGARPLEDASFLEEHQPDRVLVVGRLTLHRSAGRLLGRPGVQVEVVTPAGTWPDPGHRAQRVHPLVLAPADAASAQPVPQGGPVPTGVESARARAAEAESGHRGAWLEAWLEAGHAAGQRSQDADAADPADPKGLTTAPRSLTTAPSSLTTASASAIVAQHSLGVLFLGSSRAPRSLDLGTPGPGDGVWGIVGNRGLAGIDGCVSTAAGWALAHGPTTALVGDLTFLHDLGGLVIGPHEPRPDLTVVVLSDDGGAIFGDLEYGREPLRSAGGTTFERVFTTPTGADIAAVARGLGAHVQRVSTPQDLADAVSVPPAGLRVVEAVLARPSA